MAKNLFQVPTADIPKPLSVPKIKTEKDRRSNGRITLDELNRSGAGILREKFDEVKERPDNRPTVVKVLDIIDFPRNVIANAIGSLVGLKTEGREKAAGGVPRVYMSDILKHLGVKDRVVRGVIGFAGDVLIDPLLYASLGASTAIKVGKGLPRVLKGQVKRFGRMAKGAERLTPEVAKGIGIKAPEKMIRPVVQTAAGVARGAPVQKGGEVMRRMQRFMGRSKTSEGIQALEKAGLPRHAKMMTAAASLRAQPKHAGRMMAQRAGRLLRQPRSQEQLAATAGLLAKTTETGRTIARAPFAQRGLQLPFGKRAAWYRELVDPENLAQLWARRAAGKAAVSGVTAKATAAAAAVGAMDVAKQYADDVGRGAKQSKAVRIALEKELKAAGLKLGKGGEVWRSPEIRRLEGELQDLMGIQAYARQRVGGAQAAVARLGQKFEVTEKAKQVLTGKVSETLTPLPKGTLGHLTKRISAKRKELREAVKFVKKQGGVTRDPFKAQFKLGMRRVEERAGKTLKQVAKDRLVPLKDTAIQAKADSIKAALASQKAQAAEMSARIADEAPAAIREFERHRIGGYAMEAGRIKKPPPGAGFLDKARYAYRRGIEGARRGKVKVFGIGDSELRQRMAAIRHRWTQEAQDQAVKTLQSFRKDVVSAIKSTGLPREELEPLIVNLIEMTGGGLDAATAFHHLDPGFIMLNKAYRLGLDKNDDVARILAKYVDLADQSWASSSLRHVAPGKEADFFKRLATKDFAISAEGQAAHFGKKAWTSPRVRLLEFSRVGDDILSETEYVLSSNKELIKTLKDQGYKQSGKYRITTDYWNQIGEGASETARKIAGPNFRGKMFSTDVAESAAAIQRDKVVRGGMADFRDLVNGTGFDVPAGDIMGQGNFAHLGRPTLDQKSPFYNMIGKQMEGKVYPKPVSDLITNIFKVTAKESEMRNLIGASDWYFRQWKSMALLHPAYTFRNMWQNLFGGMMSGANPLRMAKWSWNKKLRAIRRAVEEGKDIKGMTIRVGDITYPVESIIESGKMYNMFQSAATSQVWTSGMTGPERMASMTEGMRKGGLDPVRSTFFRVNSQIETQMRLGLWFAHMEKGMTPRAAAFQTLLGMPDLSDISMFERKVFARIWPWYRWARRNGSLQAMYLANKPIFMASSERTRHAIEQIMTGNDNVPDELRPEWMRESQAVQFLGNEQEGQVFLGASWLPFQELQKAMGGAYDISELSRMAVEQARPEAKFIAETAVGQDIFRGRPVKPFGMMDFVENVPSALIGRSQTPMDNLFGLRPLKEPLRVAEQKGVARKVTRGLLGGAVQEISKERGLREAEIRLREEAANARRMLNIARDRGDTAQVRKFTKDLFRIWAEMSRLGVRGVPKATQAVQKGGGLPVAEQVFQ